MGDILEEHPHGRHSAVVVLSYH